MATTKKPKAKKPKVIVWEKVVEKKMAPYDKKLTKLFSDFFKEAEKLKLTISQRDELWAKKYRSKYKALDKAQREAVHNAFDKLKKEGYIIK